MDNYNHENDDINLRDQTGTLPGGVPIMGDLDIERKRLLVGQMEQRINGLLNMPPELLNAEQKSAIRDMDKFIREHMPDIVAADEAAHKQIIAEATTKPSLSPDEEKTDSEKAYFDKQMKEEMEERNRQATYDANHPKVPV